MAELRVLTLNIHKGFTLGNRSFVLEKLRHELRQSQADIVFLQEVVGDHHRHRYKIHGWPAKPQFEYLAETIWPHHAYGKNAIYQQGHHGNAILSHRPFSSTANIDVSFGPASQRGILHGVLADGLHVLCVHFGLLEAERKRQVRTLVDYIETEIDSDAALILAGDFNDWRSKSHKTLMKRLSLTEAHAEVHGHCAKTYPVIYPMLSVDRIYTRHCHVEHCTTLRGQHWSYFSDHCGLVADLRPN